MSVTSVGGLENVEKNQHGNSLNMINNDSVMNARATPFEPTDQFHREPSVQAAGQAAKYDRHFIGQDLLQPLKRVKILVFSGDKRTYNSWKVAFLACIDSAPATGEYKLLQLWQYLAGEALKTIENPGHSGAAYEAEKERLERIIGDMRCQIAIYMEELENFRQSRNGNAKDGSWNGRRDSARERSGNVKDKHTDGRGCSTHLVRYTAGKQAYGKSRGGISGR